MSRVLLPASLDELWTMLGDEPGCAVFAGGTDLLVRKRAGIAQGDPLVCLERIPELSEIHESDGLLRIGAGITHTVCSASPDVTKHAPVLALALRRIGSPQVRNMGTIGGNICTASPAGDSLPALHILKAEVVLRSRESERALPIADFIRGPG
ncbi:MAG: FAD binding domain-containing protein, partial [Desulfocurvibacter africanus]